jgi:hypothetical protein
MVRFKRFIMREILNCIRLRRRSLMIINLFLFRVGSGRISRGLKYARTFCRALLKTYRGLRLRARKLFSFARALYLTQRLRPGERFSLAERRKLKARACAVCSLAPPGNLDGRLRLRKIAGKEAAEGGRAVLLYDCGSASDCAAGSFRQFHLKIFSMPS